MRGRAPLGISYGDSPRRPVSVIGTITRWACWRGTESAYYHGLLLRSLPPRCHRVLDVGCGVGVVCRAGPALGLAGRAGLAELADRHLTVAGGAGVAAGAKVMALVAG